MLRRLPATLDQLRSNKNVKSVEELEADIKQMVGIQPQDTEPPSNRDAQTFVASLPNDPEELHKERSFHNEKDGMQEETEDMSAFKKFVSKSNEKLAYFYIP